MGKELGTLLHKCLACHYGFQNWEIGLTNETPNTGLSEFSVHKLMQFTACPQAWAYRWLLNIEPIEKQIPDLDVQARNMMGLYLDAYRRIDRELEPLAVEHQIIVNLESVQVSCRIDLIARYNSTIVLLDHKTAANIKSRLRGTHIELPLMVQELCFLQSGLCTQFGLPYGGFYLNLINPTCNETPINDRFRRVKLEFETSYKTRLTPTLVRAKNLQDELIGTEPWNYPRFGHINGICVNGRYGPCDYRPLCERGKSELGRYYGWLDPDLW